MKMVRSDRAASGVIFTLDTESGFRDVVFMTGSYGLGENIVQGVVDPDEFYVHKPTFKRGLPRGACRVGSAVRTSGWSMRKDVLTTRNVTTSRTDRERFCIPDEGCS